MLAALALASVPLVGKVLAAAGAIALGGWAAIPILLGRGHRAVRSFVWAADGTWRVEQLDGSWETARLLPATATLGSSWGQGWAVLLVWRADGPGAGWRRRRYALIDVWECGAPAFRSLKGRLKREAGAFQQRIGV